MTQAIFVVPPERDARAVAEDLARDFAASAAERDRAGGTAQRERDLLRASGLLALSVPRELGGGGAPWSEVLEVVRIFARADGSLAHLFGFQHLMLATARLFGTPEQWRPLLRETARQRWFWGNALNPLDARTSLKREPDGWFIDGEKSFCSGSVDSDMLIVSALRPPDPRLAIAAIPTRRSGILVRGDWDNMGQRQTDSGGVEFRRVRLEPEELLDKPGPLGSVFASLWPCIAQLIFANVYLGIAQGALAEARGYTRSARRPWILSSAASASEDPYVLQRYGELWLDLESARLLCDRAGLAVTNGMFDVMGARATSAAARFDRYWRNLRTHTLHDPVDYKFRELGDYALNERLPSPSFYS